MRRRTPDKDELYMQEAIKLAIQGMGHTSPNPTVGAVIVKGDRIIGRGHHRGAGLPHAEIEAINNSTGSLKGSTMYVTLEPCAHFGRTPPCVDAIIKSGIKRVVVGEIDPNPLVNGKGVRHLRKKGIDVAIYNPSEEISTLNCGFKKWIREKRPYVIMKAATSMDGRIADTSGLSKYITSTESRRFVHFVRYLSDAILIGAGTVRKDDPLLDHRLYRAEVDKKITRIVVDYSLSLNPDYRVFRQDGARRIIITSSDSMNKKGSLISAFEKKGVEVAPLKAREGRISIQDILEYLGRINILYLLVEGGREVFTGFLDSGEVDLFVQIIAPSILGDGSPGFYKRPRMINKSRTDYSLFSLLSLGSDALLFYKREGSDVYRIDRIYRKG